MTLAGRGLFFCPGCQTPNAHGRSARRSRAASCGGRTQH
ncbi:hypothetical protein KYC5002_31740 [Archangium violaceum]|nr:hypothetical protein KYC5002_31740 [Archangium gephyra]